MAELDPDVGAEAMAQASQARRTALDEVSAGALTLEELFAQVEVEEPKHQLGHIHLRAALLALPHIGEVKANEILDEATVDGTRHLASLGRHQRERLCALAASALTTPESDVEPPGE